MSLSFNHLCHAVRDMDEALKIYDNLWGLKVFKRLETPGAGRIMVIIPIGHSFIELVQPTREEGDLAGFLRERGPGIQHICLTASEGEREIERLRSQGAEVKEAPSRPGAPYKRWHLQPSSTHGVEIELVEEAFLDHLGFKTAPQNRGPIVALTHVHQAV